MLPEDREGYIDRYASLNFALIPLVGKKPIWADWPRQFLTDKERMKQVFLKQYPTANIGLVLEPSHTITLDIDEKRHGNETLESLEFEHGFQDTLRSITGGGGQRLFYRWPNFAVKTNHEFAPGIELLATGAQVVLPPSVHPDTHALYAWDMMEDELDRDHIQFPPEWLMRRLLDTPVLREAPALQPVEKIGRGQRHNAMVSMAGIMRERMAASETEMNAYLQTFNKERCEPPYDTAHVAQIARTVSRYTVGDPRIVSGLAKAYGQLKKNREGQESFQQKYKPLTGADILGGNYVSPEVVIEDMLTVGLTLLAGPPKVGKSFLSMQLALAVSSGAPLFGCQRITRPGIVSYLSLEEDENQTFSKLSLLRAEDGELIKKIRFQYECDRLLNGGQKFIADIIEEEHPTLLLIDSYKTFLSPPGKGSDIVANEYNQIKILGDISKQTNTAIVLIHHTSKGSQGHGLPDSFAGTHGHTAAADCLIRLQSDGSAFILEGQGRAIREFRFSLLKRFSEGIGWELKAKGEDARFSEHREAIFLLLLEEKHHGPMSPKEISSALSLKGDTTRSLLRRMIAAGQIHKNSDGKYVPLGDSL